MSKSKKSRGSKGSKVSTELGSLQKRESATRTMLRVDAKFLQARMARTIIGEHLQRAQCGGLRRHSEGRLSYRP